MENEHKSKFSYYHGKDAFDTYRETELINFIWDAIEIMELFASTEEKIKEKISYKVNDGKLSVNLFRFIPVSYCRNLFKTYKYDDEYTVKLHSSSPIKFLLSENRLYKLINESVSYRLTHDPKPTHSMLKTVLAYSKEYNFISKANQKAINPVTLDLKIPTLHFRATSSYC